MSDLAWPLVALVGLVFVFLLGLRALSAKETKYVAKGEFEKETLSLRSRVSHTEEALGQSLERIERLDARFPSIPTDFALPAGLRRAR